MPVPMAKPTARVLEAKLSRVETRHSEPQSSLAPSVDAPLVRTKGTAVVTLGSGVVVPSLIGKPVRAALEIAQESGIDIDIVGSGVAREQSPPAGTHIAAGARVEVRFSR
jgi:hypothetical protein